MASKIEARGIRVHNLKNADVSIPLGRLTVVTGVSGSGKSSLAFDTLFAEGRRRYVECFSTRLRRHLDQLPRPDVDRVDHIPPAIAVRQHQATCRTAATVADTTDLSNYLRLLFVRLGRQFCPRCSRQVRDYSPEEIADVVLDRPSDTRVQIAFAIPTESPVNEITRLSQEGFHRFVANGRTIAAGEEIPDADDIVAVVDRLRLPCDRSRLTDSIESALSYGEGRCIVLSDREGAGRQLDGRSWERNEFATEPECPECRQQFPSLTTRLLNSASPSGACGSCNGLGTVPVFSLDKVVPDPSKSLAEGAIEFWTLPEHGHHAEALMRAAAALEIPVDVPVAELDGLHRQMIFDGLPEQQFVGLSGFLTQLAGSRARRSQDLLKKWSSQSGCRTCDGSRLNENARAVLLGQVSLADVVRMTSAEAALWVNHLSEEITEQKSVARPLLRELLNRLEAMKACGLEYLTLGRAMQTLSSGEAQRVLLTTALGSRLVSTLYILDEPTSGLHAQETNRIVDAVLRLRDLGNTIVVVEHDAAFIKAADWIVHLGPGAGTHGGRVVSCGAAPAGNSNEVVPLQREPLRNTTRTPRGSLSLRAVTTNNLKSVSVDFPVGVLCVVTGLSGSGKSSLVAQSLYPAVSRQLNLDCSVDTVGDWRDVTGTEQLANIVLMDHRSIRGGLRSVPATYLGVFSPIRTVFARTSEAAKRDFSPGTFSFNSPTGGRCPKCEGTGRLAIDMQFLSDLSIVCPECDGTRFRPEVLEARYRGLSIANVLDQTADEAFALFRGHPKIQRRLMTLRDAGLGYLPLGQPVSTLSGGEAQRLKMAVHLAGLVRAANRSKRDGPFGTLFLLDEPSRGLHADDVKVLLTCFDSLVEAGHSLVIVEHHVDIIRAADHIIDLGPGAGPAGGQITGVGPPVRIAQIDSPTGRLLK